MNILQFLLTAAVLFAIVSLIWRFVSNRKLLPCPFGWDGWLRWITR
jgi:hypothetical protein